MLSITKIFRFETAHAISDYNGKCKNLHGHSYVLHVTVTGKLINEKYLENFGFIVDFKELKEIVTNNIINKLDHSTILSKKYIDNNNYLNQLNNLIIWEVEPSAENILLYIRD